jgi:hypothetical protein
MAQLEVSRCDRISGKKLSGVIVRERGRPSNHRLLNVKLAFAITGCSAFAEHDSAEILARAVTPGSGNWGFRA